MNFPDRKALRRIEAAERQERYDALTDAEKAERNPQKFGRHGDAGAQRSTSGEVGQE